MTKPIAWHGDPDLKAEVVARIAAHRVEDSIIQGLYQEIDHNLASGYRGCLIGCTLPAQAKGREPSVGWHTRVEELYGIPRAIGYLLDRIFENLPTDDGQHAVFAVASIEAVPVGADLSLVSSKLMLEILADAERGVLRHTAEGSDQRAAVEAVIALYVRRLAGDEPSRDEWLAARRDAYAADAAYADADAAAYAADAAYAGVADAAYAAYAYAYAYAAAYAADADAADAADAARGDWWTWAAQRLLHHLTHAPTPAKI
jgi:hypothetical protein